MGQQSRPDLSLVLIVDDDEDVLQVMADVLETLDYQVLTARTAREAVEELRRNSQISVLFTDIRMPDIGGEGLAGIAATWRPDIRVVSRRGSENRVETRNSSESHLEPLTSSGSFRRNRSYRRDHECGD
jgi:CheY-like chemotaxis protein